MVIGALAAAWMLMLMLVFALCRASASADTPTPLLPGDARRARQSLPRR
ncbi:MAG: hypothetical protein M3071_00150 [Actinomycetota bacterium]|nr:hypothetical protein [Actinomycetota bacterium]